MMQNDRLIAYLRENPNGLSVAEAPSAVGIGDLRKRVSECRRAGVDIRSVKESKRSPWGGIVHYNRYYLATEA